VVGAHVCGRQLVAVRSECVAICMFLEASPDPRILELLEFPAEACGYAMSSIRGWELLEEDTLALNELA
jgi:hypothetical protein